MISESSVFRLLPDRGVAISGVICCALLAACAGPSTRRIEVDPEATAREERTQKQAFVRRQFRDQKRVQELAQPLLIGAAPICEKETRPYVGMIAVNIHQWPEDYQEAAAAELGIGEAVQVLQVTPGSPADAAGIAVGDLLEEIDGRPVPGGNKAAQETAKIFEQELAVGKPSILKVERNNQQLSIEIVPVVACRYNVALVAGDQVNAYADGNNVVITSGMLRFTETDTEVSTVLSHELAHNAMGHMKKQTRNYWLGSIFDIVAAVYGVNTQGTFGKTATQVYSQDFEAEADYVGLYIMALAGVDPSEAPDFWRRMGAEHPGSIKSSYGSSHPGTAERYLAMDKTIAEIHQKKEAGEELRPTLKKKDQEVRK